MLQLGVVYTLVVEEGVEVVVMRVEEVHLWAQGG
jgi:hypothetical protein